MKEGWYVVQTHSDFEKKVADSIGDQVRRRGLDNVVEEVMVPMEEVVQLRRGAKIRTERKIFPGYVLVHLNDMTEDEANEVQYLIADTSKVIGFVGSGGKPRPMSETEVQNIRKQVREGVERPKPSITFDIGEQVRVADGPFTSFNGFVEEVDEERARLKVAVSIFGRATPVDLQYGQVEKL